MRRVCDGENADSIQKLSKKRRVEVAVSPPAYCAGVDSPTDLRFANGTSTEIF